MMAKMVRGPFRCIWPHLGQKFCSIVVWQWLQTVISAGVDQVKPNIGFRYQPQVNSDDWNLRNTYIVNASEKRAGFFRH